MKCTRCKEELIEGKNIYKDWHIPICKKCREEMTTYNITLTKEEKEIANKRYGRRVFLI